MNLSRVPIVFLSCGVATAVHAAQMPVTVGLFPQEIARSYTESDGIPSNDVRTIIFEAEGPVAITPAGAALYNGENWQALENYTLPGYQLVVQGGAYTLVESAEKANETAIEVRQTAGNIQEPAALATDQGLFLRNNAGTYEKAMVEDGLGRAWAVSDVRGVALDNEGRLWFATLAGAARQKDDGWDFFTGAEGLPYNDFTCMAAGQDGSVWFGTKRGVIRYKDGAWRYRQGRRWLPNDDVRAIALDNENNAWAATAGGVGFIGYQPMTLAAKASFYEEEVACCIKRTPFGYTSEVGLARPGDKSEIIYTDSDNDGLWTAMYGAGQCFAYAATKDPAAKERAREAFEALRFLQKVTQTGDIRPPKGYVARTILPTDGPDPNDGRIEGDIRHRDERDSLWKIYEPRWPTSGDGQWFWKSDTSSDELDGHYFFYPAYYDYAAETEDEKERVREVVRDLTDHLIEHEFNLVDFDGTPTRWGIYNPNSLNQDANWWSERGLKSLSMLSYLAVAEHMTGDSKYGDASRELIEKHNFRTNAMIYKIHFGPGSGNQSDDEMAFMCFYNLVKYTRDDALRKEMMYSFFSAYVNEQPEMNPLFNFMYAAFGLDASYQNPWGEFELKPWDGWLEDAVETLMEFPLDRIGWGHQNSHRLDLLRLPPQQSSEPYEEHRANRGYRVNGKVLPVSERFFHHWNTDPWNLDYGGNGSSLGSGTVFLLPYYMGLYHGFISN